MLLIAAVADEVRSLASPAPMPSQLSICSWSCASIVEVAVVAVVAVCVRVCVCV